MSRLRAGLVRLFGREPVVAVSLIVTMLIAALPATGWPAERIGIVAGALVVVGGAVEAALVDLDRMLPLLVGVGKAVLAVIATFGVQLPGHWVAAVMGVLTVLGGLQVRQQVVPPQAPQWKSGSVAEPLGGWVEDLAPRHLPVEPDLTGGPVRSQVPPDAPWLPERDDRPTSTMPVTGAVEPPTHDPHGRAPDTEPESRYRERGGQGRHMHGDRQRGTELT